MRCIYFMIMLSMTLQVVHLQVTIFEELITERGYPFETHSVKTEDNFILTLFRIKSRIPDENQENRKEVVLLAPGLDESADAWILNRANNSLPFYLLEKGFDVWLLNNRGCSYSREHTEYHISHSKLWDFSFQEMAQFDVPATLRFITAHTGQ